MSKQTELTFIGRMRETLNTINGVVSESKAWENDVAPLSHQILSILIQLFKKKRWVLYGLTGHGVYGNKKLSH
jgi:hypothetical protein